MLKIDKDIEVFEAVSEVDGTTVMTFKAAVNKKDPSISSLDISKASESVYKSHRDEASADREEFQNMIFDMVRDIENPCQAFDPVSQTEVIDGEFVDAKNVVDPEDVNHDFDEEVTENVEN